MWWGNPEMTPKQDSVEIDSLHNRPLFFETQEECYKHVDDNLLALKAFGRAVFPTATAVKAIYCIEKDNT